MTVPHIQVHRFASPELGIELGSLWRTRIENPEVRQTLLCLIAAGPIANCADLAHGVAQDAQAAATERMIAVDAIVAIGDPPGSTTSRTSWRPDTLRGLTESHGASCCSCFPDTSRLTSSVRPYRWVKGPNSHVGDLSWHCPA